jgi:flagellar basal body-associated protein FliL
MKRVIVIIILLILVGGGGAGGLIMLGVLPNPFKPEVQGTAAEMAAGKAEAAKKTFVPPSSVITFVDLPDMIIPVLSDGQIKNRVFLSVRIWVTGNDAKKEIEESETRLQNAILKEFIPYFEKKLAKDELPDVRDIKKRLVAMSKRLYGEKVVDVLLINVFEQKFGPAK